MGKMERGYRGVFCTILKFYYKLKTALKPNLQYFFISHYKNIKKQINWEKIFPKYLIINLLVLRFNMKLFKSKLALSHLCFAGHFPNKSLTLWISP